MTFDKTDLLITEAELSGITTALANDTVTTPIETAIAQAQTQVEAYTGRYVVPDNWLKKLVRAVALHDLYAQIGQIPPQRKDAYDAALKELEAIRDGKFPTLEAAEPAPGSLSTGEGSYGSETKFNARSSETSDT